jgi:hypothetical protein
VLRLFSFCIALLASVGCNNEHYAVDYDDYNHLLTVVTSNDVRIAKAGPSYRSTLLSIKSSLPKLPPLQIVKQESNPENRVVLMQSSTLPRVWQANNTTPSRPIQIDAFQISRCDDNHLFVVFRAEENLEDCGTPFALGIFNFESLSKLEPVWSSKTYCGNSGALIHFPRNLNSPVVTLNRLPIEIYVMDAGRPLVNTLQLERSAKILDTEDPLGRDTAFVVSEDLQFLAMSQSYKQQWSHIVWDLKSGNVVFDASGNQTNDGFKGDCVYHQRKVFFAEGIDLTEFSLIDFSIRKYHFSVDASYLRLLYVDNTSVWALVADSASSNYRDVKQVEFVERS